MLGGLLVAALGGNVRLRECERPPWRSHRYGLAGGRDQPAGGVAVLRPRDAVDRRLSAARDFFWRSLGLLALAGIVHFAWARHCNYRATKAMGANLVAPVQQYSLVITLLLAVVWLGEFADAATHCIGIVSGRGRAGTDPYGRMKRRARAVRPEAKPVRKLINPICRRLFLCIAVGAWFRHQPDPDCYGIQDERPGARHRRRLRLLRRGNDCDLRAAPRSRGNGAASNRSTRIRRNGSWFPVSRSASRKCSAIWRSQ